MSVCTDICVPLNKSIPIYNSSHPNSKKYHMRYYKQYLTISIGTLHTLYYLFIGIYIRNSSLVKYYVKYVKSLSRTTIPSD